MGTQSLIPRQQTYIELVTAIQAFLLTLESGEQFQPQAIDLEFAGKLHQVLEAVPIKYEGMGEP